MVTLIMDYSAFHVTWLIDWLFSLKKKNLELVQNYVTIAQNPKWDQVDDSSFLNEKWLNYRKSVIN